MQQQAKKLIEQLKGEGINRYDYTDEAMELCREYDAQNGYFDIVDDEIIDEIIKRDIDSYGWERVACFLSGAETSTPYGYRIDGYGNLQNIHFDDIMQWLEEIAESVEG